jgi:hypothetical protein
MTLAIKFTDFWSDFDQRDNFFIDVLQNHLEEKIEVVFDYRIPIDLEICSVFSPKSALLLKKAASFIREKSFVEPKWREEKYGITSPRNSNVGRRIWYSGENIRAPYSNQYDGFLGFDQNLPSASHQYLPLWMLHLGWYEESRLNPRLGLSVHANDLLTARRLPKEHKSGFCAFIGNPDPIRLRAIDSLHELQPAKLHGRFFNSPVKDKLSVSKSSIYMLCFENDSYPGYVTEKIVEAYLAETVPLYWGDFGIAKLNSFNEKAFINFADFENLDDFVRYVRSANWKKMYQEPLLQNLPDINPIAQIILGDL